MRQQHEKLLKDRQAGKEASGSQEDVSQRIETENALRPEDERFPLQAHFNDGFVLETWDREYQLQLHLMNQTDFKVFDPGYQQPARSGLYNPRFRVYFEGQLTRPFEYELSLQRSVEGTFDVLDANLNFHFWDAFQIKFGRFLVPFSYDWYDHLEQYFITPERGLFPLNYGLSREAGLMAHGRFLDGRVQYAVGGFDGQLVGLADTNTTRDGVGYVNFLPFLKTESVEALRFFGFGGSMALGQQAFPVHPLPLRTSVQSSENDEAAAAASAIFLRFNDDVVARGSRAQGAIHMNWYRQQMSLECEWATGRFSYARDQTGTTGVPVTGYHVAMGYFITGETVERRTTVIPLRPFDLTRQSWGPGAIELFCRYSRLNLGNEVFTAGLADSNQWTNRCAIIDTGFNWYLNRYIKFYFDWQHSQFGSPVLLNAGEQKYSRSDDLYWVRCQVYF